MTREMIKQVENDYWKEKADPIDMAEVFDLANKALEQEPTLLSSELEKNSKKLENPTKKYCGCCKHWKIKGVQKIGDKPTSYGKCTKLSISGFEVETTFNDNCSSEGLE